MKELFFVKNRSERILSFVFLALICLGSRAAAEGRQEAEIADGPVLTITDQTGRRVAVPSSVERVVTIPIPAASMMIAIDGGTDRLVGMHPKSKSALEEGILREFFPEALDIRSDVVGNGFMPNVETLLQVDPQLVFQWGHLGADVTDPLENAGINTALLLYGNQEYLEGWIQAFGTVLGREEKAQRILDWHQATLEEIRGAMEAVPQDEKPRVLYFLRYLSSKSVAAQGTYNDFYLNLAGAVNPAGDMKSFPEISEEQIIAWDPEIILLNGFESDLSPADVYGNEKLADVSAVKNHKVYKVPLGGYRWDPPNQESPLMWKWLAMVFHPEMFSYDLRAEIVANYEWIYGKIPTEDQIDGILRIDMNADAAGYSVFKRK
ncbi:ABC transporter substrate-binding protein [Marispirochaeta aestuarii]|uniref:ABC transporter substrate-binding protein n=1 Tax=Marispirochaeta aestuarii TaxID=1963862 RepID=UPI002ABE89AF|nr:ABC transporter substrate-binding protein [Marispirochaeta aestuarii]